MQTPQRVLYFLRQLPPEVLTYPHSFAPLRLLDSLPQLPPSPLLVCLLLFQRALVVELLLEPMEQLHPPLRRALWAEFQP